MLNPSEISSESPKTWWNSPKFHMTSKFVCLNLRWKSFLDTNRLIDFWKIIRIFLEEIR